MVLGVLIGAGLEFFAGLPGALVVAMLVGMLLASLLPGSGGCRVRPPRQD